MSNRCIRRIAVVLACVTAALVAGLDARSPSAAAGPGAVGGAAPQRVRAAGVRTNASAESTGPLAWMAERDRQAGVCPAGWCDTVPGRVLVKLAPPSARVRQSLAADDERVAAREAERAAALQMLGAQGVRDLQPLFPQAAPPRERASVMEADGQAVPVPDLTRWYVAQVADGADVQAVAALLATTEGVAAAEPDYLRRPIGGTGLRPGLRPEPVEGRRPIGGSRASTGPSVASAAPSKSTAPQVRQGGRTRAGSSTLVSNDRQPLGDTIPLPGQDPLRDQQWHLGAVQALEAWTYLESRGFPPGGSRDIVVAVIDTGVDYTHQDLAANIWSNSREIPANGVDDDGNGYVDDVHGIDATNAAQAGNPMDDHGHGTHVAGIIAAQAGNGVGGVGIAYNVQIMALKAAQYSGVLATSDIAEAIYYAVAQGAAVINMSFGGYVRSAIEEDALTMAFGQAVLVAAAGNDGVPNERMCNWWFGRPMYPAAYNWVLGVMAAVPGGGAAGFSNTDCIARNTIEYELLAPGVDILSTLPRDQYAAWDGTSMAAPIVSGIAALLRTANPDKDSYSSRYIMGQIASNAGSGANAYSALAVAPKPSLSYLRHWAFDSTTISPSNDGDGVIDSGETIDLAVVIRNHWGKAEDVHVTVEPRAQGSPSLDPFVTITPGVVDYGAVGHFSEDDNGLILDAGLTPVGVRSPFRVVIDSTTPNDHIIPLQVTITAINGLDGEDQTVYTSVSRSELRVSRGRDVPRLITADLTLTNDSLWLVRQSALVYAGVTLRIDPGTRIEFSNNAKIQVEGVLRAEGSWSSPVELFPDPLVPLPRFHLYTEGAGQLFLNYTRLTNAFVRAGERPPYWQYSFPAPGVADHCWLTQEGDFGLAVQLQVQTIRNSIIYRVGGGCCYPYMASTGDLQGNLIDHSVLWIEGQGRQLTGNVFLWNQDPVAALLGTGIRNVGGDAVRDNAILNPWLSGPPWLVFHNTEARGTTALIANNFWGGAGNTKIGEAVWDFYDDFNYGEYVYQPVLTTAPESAYPFVADVRIASDGVETDRVGAKPVAFTVTFNRDMDQTVQPQVSFGPDTPLTDYTVHPVDGGWQNARTWAGTFNINPTTGDGYQLVRVAGARAADDPWLVTGNDGGRFRFEIITSGTEAMNLQATGAEGRVDLMWTQNDFDLLAGYNLYRATSVTGAYARVNEALIPSAIKSFVDASVEPGQPYFYTFTVVKTDMTESASSNVATATPTDTILPVIQHTPIQTALPRLALTVAADVTDNVRVAGATLFYRATGAGAGYTPLAMTSITGARYTATIDAARVGAPGLDYYLEATDGVSTAHHGWPETPWQVVVTDRPVVTAISPPKGPASGGTPVVIVGSNFKAGATVTLGGTVCAPVLRDSENQLRCTTAAHFPTVADVTVTNPDNAEGTLLRAFTYEADVATISFPAATGGQGSVVQVPIHATAVSGLAAADVTVTFDAGVLRARRVLTGTLIPGWSLQSNVTTAGRVVMGMASGGGTVTGSGTLVVLEFDVVGGPASATPLRIQSARLNDGAIPSQVLDGTFAVDNVYVLGGTVRFWSSGAVVPGTLLTLTGDRTFTNTTDAAGQFALTGVPNDGYVLRPSKSDAGADGISAYDASLVLQHAVELSTLTGAAAVAADVNKNNVISSMDAFYILQKTVDLIALPFPGAGVVWDYQPATRSYDTVTAHTPDQDFTAILLGDVSGNWTPPGAAPDARVRSAARDTAVRGAPAVVGLPAVVRLPAVVVAPGERVTVPVRVMPGGQSFTALELVVTYDPAVVTPVSVVKGAAVPADWLLVSTTRLPGAIRLAWAGTRPLAAGGTLAELTLQALGAAGTRSALGISAVRLDDRVDSVTLVPGRVAIVTLAPPRPVRVRGVTLTADKTPPQVVGTTVTWTATATGGTAPLQYKWFVANGGAAAVVAQDWSASTTYAWTPTAAGASQVGVWVRSAGATADRPEAVRIMPMRILATAPMVGLGR